MIIYESTKREFMNKVVNDEIVDYLYQEYKEKTGRRTSQNEQRSWKNSLLHMYIVLDTDKIPMDCGIAIEYKIPASAKRIDFMLTGYDKQKNPNVVIFELKQWEHTESVSNKDGIVKTFVGGSVREVVHPSYQAMTYASLLEDYNKAVINYGLQLHPCAYLHNYDTKEENDILNDIYNEYIQQAPVFTKGDVRKLREFASQYICCADESKIINELEAGKIAPSKSLQDALSKMLKGNDEFQLIDDQKIIYEDIFEKKFKLL